MRSSYAIALTALLVAAPAMGQVIIQTPNGDAARHEERAEQDRANAHMERQEAEQRAAIGDYGGAAAAQRESRADWHAARRQEHRAHEESGAVVIGR
jgi:hypothetical protein